MTASFDPVVPAALTAYPDFEVAEASTGA